MTSAHPPVQAPPASPAAASCEHDVGDFPSTMLRAQQLASDHNSASSQVRRVSGGDRELLESRCPSCRCIVSYTLKHLDDGRVENIGVGPEVVQAALVALLAQPAAHVFAIVTGTSRWVLPRHHLPRVEVGRF